MKLAFLKMVFLLSLPGTNSLLCYSCQIKNDAKLDNLCIYPHFVYLSNCYEQGGVCSTTYINNILHRRDCVVRKNPENDGVENARLRTITCSTDRCNGKGGYEFSEENQFRVWTWIAVITLTIIGLVIIYYAVKQYKLQVRRLTQLRMGSYDRAKDNTINTA